MAERERQRQRQTDVVILGLQVDGSSYSGRVLAFPSPSGLLVTLTCPRGANMCSCVAAETTTAVPTHRRINPTVTFTYSYGHIHIQLLRAGGRQPGPNQAGSDPLVVRATRCFLQGGPRNQWPGVQHE